MIFWISAFFVYFFYQKNKLNLSSSIENEYVANDSLLCCLYNFEINNNVSAFSVFSDNDIFASQIDSITNNGMVLVYRISDRYCSSCISDGFDLLEENSDDIIDKIMIWGTYSNINELKKMNSKKQINHKVLLMQNNILPKEVESLNTPYYFVLTPNKKMINIFIPDKHFPALTINYFLGIKRLFNN